MTTCITVVFLYCVVMLLAVKNQTCQNRTQIVKVKVLNLNVYIVNCTAIVSCTVANRRGDIH